MTRKIDLTGCHEKLDRSAQNLKSLDTEIQVHINSGAYGMVGYLNKKTGRKQIDFEIHKPNPPLWGVIVGEFAHNLRGVLDHLIYQVSGKRNNTAFPIFTDPDHYFVPDECGNARRETMLRGVPAKYRTLIDGYQPFQRSGEKTRDPLALLAWLNNADKHRLIHSSVTWMNRFEDLDVTFPDDDVTSFAARLIYKLGTPLRHNTPMYEVIVTPNPAAKMQMKSQVPLRVAFGGRNVERGGLTRIQQYVADLLERFESAM